MSIGIGIGLYRLISNKTPGIGIGIGKKRFWFLSIGIGKKRFFSYIGIGMIPSHHIGIGMIISVEPYYNWWGVQNHWEDGREVILGKLGRHFFLVLQSEILQKINIYIFAETPFSGSRIAFCSFVLNPPLTICWRISSICVSSTKFSII